MGRSRGDRRRAKAGGTLRAAHRRPRATTARRGLLARFARWAAYWGAVAGIWLALAAGAAVAWYARDLPDPEAAAARPRLAGITVEAANGIVLANYGEVYGEHLDTAELPGALVEAVVATEDRRFFRHFGVDPWGLARAAVANLGAGRLVQGGSTITQQIAKNVFLTPERSVKRKVQELLLALWLERRFTKHELLTIYLNRVYLGAGAYGVDAAARRYFGKSARDLTLAEAAMIAGLPKAPSRYAPTRDLALARARAAVVLEAMVAAGSLAAGEAARAKAAPATVTSATVAAGGSRYFADWVVDQLPDFVGPAARDLIVVTTLSPWAQRAGERAVADALDGAGRDLGARQAALVAMTPDGGVRAMVGGRAYHESQFNRVTQARRQPGSAFKIAVYAAALEAGWSPDDMVADSPIRLAGWSPSNYGEAYLGDITLRRAFALSSNSVAVQLSERVGRRHVIEAARRLGIGAPLPDHPSLALGVGELSPLELTAAYATVANGGRGVIPYGIVEIRDRAGRVLYRRTGSGPGRALAAPVAAALDGLLRAAVAEGTGKRAALAGPAAGKTGTSQDFRDAWFVGYRPDLVAGVWLGNDDGTPMRKVTGGGLPAHLWRDFMTRTAP